MTRFLRWLKPRGPQLTLRDREPAVTRFLDGVWVYEEDQHTVRRLFFRLLRDHCGQEFADYAFVLLNHSLTAYAESHPSRVKPSYEFEPKRLHPANVRTGEELEGRPLEEVQEEIAEHAAAVAAACGARWGDSPRAPMCEQGGASLPQEVENS